MVPFVGGGEPIGRALDNVIAARPLAPGESELVEMRIVTVMKGNVNHQVDQS